MVENGFFEKFLSQREEQLPFVLYRKPGLEGEAQKVTGILQNDAELYRTTNFSESGFVFAPFNLENEIILIPENTSEKLTTEIQFPDEMSSKKVLETPEDLQKAKQQHIQLVEEAVKVLKLGNLDKVVLSRAETISLEETNFLSLFQKLLRTYPTAFVYCWYHPKVGCWLGATPEKLLKVSGNNFTTMALAGTQKFAGNLDPRWGEKEKQEQQYVTDAILNGLQEIGVEGGEIEHSNTITTKAGNLLHLRTDISGKIPNAKRPQQYLEDIIRVLHPTPAVCGLPKEKARTYILSEEKYNREFYSGFLGELNIRKNVQRTSRRRNVENLAYRAVKKESDLYVNLRCMKIENSQAILFVGGGITKDSIPEAEWEETVNKTQTMKKILS